MGQAGQQLQYAAERLPWYRWKRVQRGTVWGAICIAVGVFALVWGPRCWRWAKVPYWRQQCLTYTAPGDQVVLELNPDRANQLLKNGRGYVSWPMGSGKTAAGLPVRVFDKHEPWLAQYTMPILFMHGRSINTGEERVVVVAVWPSSGFAFRIRGWVAEPDSQRSRMSSGPGTPAQHATWAVNRAFELAAKGGDLRFFAGQSDPHDKSHFTIKYEVNGQSGILDGWLQEANVWSPYKEEVMLQVRDGPAATMPAEPERFQGFLPGSMQR